MATTIPSDQHSGNAAYTERIVPYNSEERDTKIGKSVEYALLPDVKYWFPIRATHHRAQKIYDKIVSLRNDCLEPYLPILRHIEYTNEDFKVSHIIASGCLIRSEVIEKVGYLREDWFIGYIDFEYCFRAAQSGFVSIVAKDACMLHLMGDKQILIFGRKIGIYSPFRRYFDCRNTLLMQKEKVFPKALRHHYLKLIFGKMCVSLIYGPKRFAQFLYCLRGFYDGLRGRIGKCPI